MRLLQVVSRCDVLLATVQHVGSLVRKTLIRVVSACLYLQFLGFVGDALRLRAVEQLAVLGVDVVLGEDMQPRSLWQLLCSKQLNLAIHSVLFGLSSQWTQTQVLSFLVQLVDGVLLVNEVSSNPLTASDHLQIDSSVKAEKDQSVATYT